MSKKFQYDYDFLKGNRKSCTKNRNPFYYSSSGKCIPQKLGYRNSTDIPYHFFVQFLTSTLGYYN